MVKPSFISNSEILSRHSTLGIGGPADFFAVIKTQDELAQAVAFARDMQLDTFTLGQGSNVLFSDAGFRGLILKMSLREIILVNNELEVRAGSLVSTLVGFGDRLGFSGFEKFAGLPGTVGGALYGNAGCFGAEFWQNVVCVTFFDGKGFSDICPCDSKFPLFSYRGSVFKDHPDWVIVSARLKLERRNCHLVREESKETAKSRADRQPKTKSAGCVFKNPNLRGERISAGKLIDAVGLKGARIGGAKISEAHANFFINNGNAEASDFRELIGLARGRVFEKFGVMLEEEIVEVGEF